MSLFLIVIGSQSCWFLLSGSQSHWFTKLQVLNVLGSWAIVLQRLKSQGLTQNKIKLNPCKADEET